MKGQTNEDNNAKQPTLFERVIAACREKQPEVEQCARMGGFMMYGITSAMDKANPELRREIFDLYIEHRTSQGGKLYSESELLTRPSIAELDLSDLNIDPRAMYDEAMEDEAFWDAKYTAIHFKLGKKVEDAATMKHVEQQLAKIEAGERVTFEEPALYDMMRRGPGLGNPIGRKCAKMLLEGMESGRYHGIRAMVVKEAFGEEIRK